MKKLFHRLFFFIGLPIICWAIIESKLPPTQFTFRAWEALLFQTRVPARGAFYPNTTSKINSPGDLCIHTDYAIIKSEFWHIDELGFRNDQFIPNPDVLIIGDSFIAGCSLSQDEIISNQMIKLDPNLSVYNMAPSTFSKFDRYLKSGIIKKPKIIIFSIVERDVPEVLVPYHDNYLSKFKNLILQISETAKFNMYIDKIFKFSSIHWLISRINNTKGKGIQGERSSRLFFMKGKLKTYSETDLKNTAEIISSYKKYCDLNGIEFLFIPMPDKESVYYELVPFSKQPDYLFRLDSLLKKKNVTTINTLGIYNDYRASHNELLYHLDDSHWNSNATKLMANEIVHHLKRFNN